MFKYDSDAGSSLLEGAPSTAPRHLPRTLQCMRPALSLMRSAFDEQSSIFHLA